MPVGQPIHLTSREECDQQIVFGDESYRLRQEDGSFVNIEGVALVS